VKDKILKPARKEISEICSHVLARIEPNEEERKKTLRLADTLRYRLANKLRDQNIEAEVRIEGSVAKDTWLASENDIDIFVLLPKTASRELFPKILGSAKKLGGRWRVRYAEHPYLQTEIEGYRVEIVPCFQIDSTRELISAVDRTPFHTQYVKEHASEEIKREIRLLKRFAIGTGCYGAELKTQGFSGYLCELLTLHHGSFQKLIEAASGWKPGTIIDHERSYADESEPAILFEGQPLVVIDPVDPNRNVAAAVSAQSFAAFVRACQEFLSDPRPEFFFPKKVKLLDAREVRRILKRRGTKIFCVAFETPDLVPDVLYPQLRKTEHALVARLEQAGFEVQRSDVWGDSKSVILIELGTSKLARVQTRVGPPVTIEVKDFIREHLRSKERITGPFVDATGRVVFELEREEIDAGDVLKRALEERVAFGKHVAEAIKREYEIVEDAGLVKLLHDKKFREFISEYLTRCLPWYR